MLDPVEIAVVGTGYVGLVSGACLAARGHSVTLLDVRENIVGQINKGIPTIHEKNLPELLNRVVCSGNLKAALATPQALGSSEIVFICVGTPSRDGTMDLSQIRDAARLVGEWLANVPHFASVIVKSTVLPGTTDHFVAEILEKFSGKKIDRAEFGLGMNPEFLREGEAVADFDNPDRIIFGHENEQTLAVLKRVYSPWDCDKLAVNSRTAEMIKYANNCLLALQISAANELANIAVAQGGIDFMDVVKGVGLDKRWNPIISTGRVDPGILSYLVPGCGFGGSCFPKDVEAMRTHAREAGVPPRMLQAILDVNAAQPVAILSPLIHALGNDLSGKKILILGLAFKPGTDDVRESASLKIARFLIEAGAEVTAHDPVAVPNACAVLSPGILTLTEDWEHDLKHFDGVVVATAWPEYESLKNHAAGLRGKIILDCRRYYNPKDFPDSLFLAVGMGPK